MVSALGYERSEPGFESRRPESDFTPRHQKTEEKSAVPPQRHLQPLVTITPVEAQQLQLSRTDNICHAYHASVPDLTFKKTYCLFAYHNTIIIAPIINEAI